MKVPSATTKKAINKLNKCHKDMLHSVEALFAVYDPLVEKLQEWVRENNNSIHKAYLCMCIDIIMWKFIAVQKRVPFDGDLMDKMSDCDVEIARDKRFRDINIDSMVMPRVSSDDALSAFVYGKFITEIK